MYQRISLPQSVDVSVVTMGPGNEGVYHQNWLTPLPWLSWRWDYELHALPFVGVEGLAHEAREGKGKRGK
jgi:hypothetical protein